MNEELRRLSQEYEDLMKQGRYDAAHRVLAQRDRMLLAARETSMRVVAENIIKLMDQVQETSEAEEGNYMDTLAKLVAAAVLGNVLAEYMLESGCFQSHSQAS